MTNLLSEKCDVARDTFVTVRLDKQLDGESVHINTEHCQHLLAEQM